MVSISGFLNERFIAKQIDALVDETESRLLTRKHLIDKYFPTRTFETRNFMGLLTRKVVPAAMIVGYGAEIPVQSFGSAEKMAAQLCKLAASRMYDEIQQWEMQEAYKLGGYMYNKIQTIHRPDGGTERGANNDLALALFGDIKDLLDGIVDRMDAMKWQVVQTGAVDVKDNKTGAIVTLDFKKEDATYNHFPVPLIATGNTVTPNLNKWSDATNAQGLQNLADLVDLYDDTNGFIPDEIVMHRKLWRKFLDQKSTRDAARAMTVTEIGLVSDDLGQKLLEKRDLPKVSLFGEKYQEQLPNGDIVDTNFLNTNRIVFLKQDMGISAIGPTIESSTNVIGSGKDVPEPKSGIYLTTYQETKMPVRDVSTAVATFLPIVMNPKLLMSQVVD